MSVQITKVNLTSTKTVSLITSLRVNHVHCGMSCEQAGA